MINTKKAYFFAKRKKFELFFTVYDIIDPVFQVQN